MDLTLKGMGISYLKNYQSFCKEPPLKEEKEER